MKTLFKVLDYITAFLMGIGTLFLATIVVGNEWNMLLAMVTGMIAGMVVLLMALVLFSPFSTPFELLPKGMVITMATGMVAGMLVTVDGAETFFMIAASAVFSICVQAGFDFYNMKLRGDVPVDEEQH